MGALIVCVPPISGTTFDKWNVYRATSKTGSYSKITATPQALTDLTYYDKDGSSTSWYKVTYYDSTNFVESSQSDPQQVTAEIYTSAKKVADFMGVSEFTDSTTPTLDKIINLINAAQDMIDDRTHHAWREKTVTDELYDLFEKQYKFGTGRAIYLKRRKIRTFSSSSGDKLEIWNGGTWEDWISTKTEGRAEDYWVDYERGVIYLRLTFVAYYEKSVRATFRFGETSVPYDIQMAATKIVARDLLYQEDKTFLLPEGSSQISWRDKLDKMDEDIDEILNNHTEWQLVGT